MARLYCSKRSDFQITSNVDYSQLWVLGNVTVPIATDLHVVESCKLADRLDSANSLSLTDKIALAKSSKIASSSSYGNHEPHFFKEKLLVDDSKRIMKFSGKDDKPDVFTPANKQNVEVKINTNVNVSKTQDIKPEVNKLETVLIKPHLLIDDLRKKIETQDGAIDEKAKLVQSLVTEMTEIERQKTLNQKVLSKSEEVNEKARVIIEKAQNDLNKIAKEVEEVLTREHETKQVINEFELEDLIKTANNKQVTIEQLKKAISALESKKTINSFDVSTSDLDYDSASDDFEVIPKKRVKLTAKRTLPRINDQPVRRAVKRDYNDNPVSRGASDIVSTVFDKRNPLNHSCVNPNEFNRRYDMQDVLGVDSLGKPLIPLPPHLVKLRAARKLQTSNSNVPSKLEPNFSVISEPKDSQVGNPTSFQPFSSVRSFPPLNETSNRRYSTFSVPVPTNTTKQATQSLNTNNFSTAPARNSNELFQSRLKDVIDKSGLMNTRPFNSSYEAKDSRPWDFGNRSAFDFTGNQIPECDVGASYPSVRPFNLPFTQPGYHNVIDKTAPLLEVKPLGSQSGLFNDHQTIHSDSNNKNYNPYRLTDREEFKRKNKRLYESVGLSEKFINDHIKSQPLPDGFDKNMCYPQFRASDNEAWKKLMTQGDVVFPLSYNEFITYDGDDEQILSLLKHFKANYAGLYQCYKESCIMLMHSLCDKYALMNSDSFYAWLVCGYFVPTYGEQNSEARRIDLSNITAEKFFNLS